jgi:hypothetical protein
MRWRWALPGAASFKPGALTTARTFERTRQHIMRDVAAMAAGGTGDLNEHDPALPDRGSSFVNKRRVTASLLGETRHLLKLQQQPQGWAVNKNLSLTDRLLRPRKRRCAKLVATYDLD